MLKRCQKWILQVKISQFTCIICFKWTILKMTFFQYGRHPPSWISPNKHIFFDHTRRFWVIGVMYYPKTPKLFGWKKFPRFPKNQGSATGLKENIEEAEYVGSSRSFCKRTNQWRHVIILFTIVIGNVSIAMSQKFKLVLPTV